MAHWKVQLSYHGGAFHGWQVQPGLATVQGTLAQTIRAVFGEDLQPQGSGRTDTGVHALAQVASFTLSAELPAANLLRALNRALPASIRILTAEQVPPDFHARHSARRKTYEYRIFERRVRASETKLEERICTPFHAPFVWDCRWPLDFDRMQRAAHHLVGEHDFTSFAATDPDRAERAVPDSIEATAARSNVRTIFAAAWSHADDTLLFRITGNGFLHHMVRNLVGTLVEVGRGSLEPAAIPAILAARDRRAAGPTAPPQGLFLLHVDYGESA